MSAMMTPYRRRGRQAIIAIAAAVLLLGAGAAAVWRDASLGERPEVSGPVVEGWNGFANTVERIEIITASDVFAMERTQAGWVMPSRGNYPVRPERIAALDEAMAALQFQRAMTRDADKFDRLGVGSPLQNGAGVRLTVLDGEQSVLADLIVGTPTPDGSGLYLRPAGDGRAYSALGALPDLSDPGYWLGLTFWDIDPSAIAAARISPEQGPSWSVQRAGLAARNHELMEPEGWRFITGGAANGVAAAGGRLRFRDVKPAGELVGAFTASHAGQTFSGIGYQFNFVAEGEDRWATIEVRALADDARVRAERLQGFVEGWAFKVSEDAYERLTRSLDQVAEAVAVQQPGPDDNED